MPFQLLLLQQGFRQLVKRIDMLVEYHYCSFISCIDKVLYYLVDNSSNFLALASGMAKVTSDEYFIILVEDHVAQTLAHTVIDYHASCYTVGMLEVA